MFFFRMYITGATANKSNVVHALKLFGDLVLIGDAFHAFSYLAMLPAQQMGDSQRNSIGTKPQSNKRAVLNVIEAKDCVFFYREKSSQSISLIYVAWYTTNRHFSIVIQLEKKSIVP